MEAGEVQVIAVHLRGNIKNKIRGEANRACLKKTSRTASISKETSQIVEIKKQYFWS